MINVETHICNIGVSVYDKSKYGKFLYESVEGTVYFVKGDTLLLLRGNTERRVAVPPEIARDLQYVFKFVSCDGKHLMFESIISSSTFDTITRLARISGNELELLDTFDEPVRFSCAGRRLVMASDKSLYLFDGRRVNELKSPQFASWRYGRLFDSYSDDWFPLTIRLSDEKTFIYDLKRDAYVEVTSDALFVKPVSPTAFTVMSQSGLWTTLYKFETYVYVDGNIRRLHRFVIDREEQTKSFTQLFKPIGLSRVLVALLEQDAVTFLMLPYNTEVVRVRVRGEDTLMKTDPTNAFWFVNNEKYYRVEVGDCCLLV